MIYLPEKTSRARQREAQQARENRAEIVKALSRDQITRRELHKWGIFTATGALVLKNGLSPFARSAFAASEVPTGAPRSPLFGAVKFRFPLQRLNYQKPTPLTSASSQVIIDPSTGAKETENVAVFPAASGEPDAHRYSYHTDYSYFKSHGVPDLNNEYVNPATGRGPVEGRPPGKLFAHQRWDEFFPKVGYVMSLARIAHTSYFYGNGTDHGGYPDQDKDSVWTYGTGRCAHESQSGTLPPFLIKGRYGEPILTRIYNALPDDSNHEDNNGFGRNESQLHFHNAHNGAESDGAANVHHFPGTFYDYRWSTTLARRDTINIDANDPRASGPDGNGGIVKVAGDFREIQGTMWAHDHRFFFTAENVYKGNLGMVTYYSGKDRGNEKLSDSYPIPAKNGAVEPLNLRLPSGSRLDWGNIDFDVNLVIRDAAWDQDGQLFFDIFTTDGFVGDVILVNESYAPYFEVLPRKYRFRTLSAGMSRWIRLQLTDAGRKPLQNVQFIANDGNLLVSPTTLANALLPVQGTAERFDIVVDFSQIPVGGKAYLYNVLQHDDGLGPKRTVPLGEVPKRALEDPAVGPILEFRVVGQVASIDEPGFIHYATDPDLSQVPAVLTEQIPLVTPVRTRVVEWGRSIPGDSLANPTVPGSCTPDCGTEVSSFPWFVKINGKSKHSMNANRVSLVYPKAGDIEHWTYVNGGGGWDHPIHLHFEEGITFRRNGQPIADPTENLVRKDVWRLGPSGSVTFQIQFGEYGGSYVNHCHNTVHEDFALLMRIQLLSGQSGTPQSAITYTPNPSRDGVTFTKPELLSEGNPTNVKAFSLP
jgi:FtsP/CotA-like multicopper oxidase with cupredoxin domain